MIDETALTDPARCPSCGMRLGPSPTCPSCGVPLRGELALRVWEASLAAAAALRTRAELVTQLRTPTGPPRVPAAAPTAAPPTAAPPTAAPPTAPYPPFAAPAPAPLPYAVASSPDARKWAAQQPPPREKWNRAGAQALLVGLGALLLAVAATVFVAVSWDRLGIGGRATVMAIVTAAAAGSAALAHRRKLTATAEALGALTVGLALLDVLAVRLTGLGGLDVPALDRYWAGGTALVAIAALISALAVPLRSWRWSAAALAQLPLPLLAAGELVRSGPEGGGAAALLTLASLLAVIAAAGLRHTARDAAVILGIGGAIAWPPALLLSMVVAAGTDGAVALRGSALLLLLGASAALTARIEAPRVSAPQDVRTIGGSLAALATVLAAGLPAVRESADQWTSTTFAALALATAAACLLLPRIWRAGPAAIAACVAALTGVSVLEAWLTAAIGPLTWAAEPWTGRPSGTSAAQFGYTPFDWDGGTPLLAALALLALTACVLALALLERPHHTLIVTVVVGAAGTWVAVLPSAGFTLTTTVLSELALAVAASLAGVTLLRREPLHTLGAALATAGALLGARALGWSLAADTLTVTALAVALAALAVAGLAGAPWLRPGLLAVGSALLLAESVAITAYLDHGRTVCGGVLAVTAAAMLAACAAVLLVRDLPGRAGAAGVSAAGWLIGLALAFDYLPINGPTVAALAAGLAAAALAAAFGPQTVRDQALPAAALLLSATAGAITSYAGGSFPDAALAATIAAGLALAAAAHGLPAVRRRSGASELAAGAAGAVALLVTSLDPYVLWLGLLAAGVALALLAARPDRRPAGWASAVLLTASSWVRLSLSDIDAPEAYTVPAALALLVVGWQLRRRVPATSSWAAYAPGLVLALAPSLTVAVDDPRLLRPALLGLAALAVLLVGAGRRLQAPLVIGGAVLAVDAVVQLAPWLAAAYDAVPRWSLLALAGLLLLGLGATYERRLRDVRRMSDGFARLA